MARYIEIDNLEVADYVTVWDCNCSEYGKQTVMAVDELQYLPTSDVQEVKHGKWEWNTAEEARKRKPSAILFNSDNWFCSVCEYHQNGSFRPSYDYCPNCGADMREVKSNE